MRSRSIKITIRKLMKFYLRNWKYHPHLFEIIFAVCHGFREHSLTPTPLLNGPLSNFSSSINCITNTTSVAVAPHWLFLSLFWYANILYLLANLHGFLKYLFVMQLISSLNRIIYILGKTMEKKSFSEVCFFLLH